MLTYSLKQQLKFMQEKKERNKTSKHLKLLERHGFNIFKTDILDSIEDLELEIPNGLVIKKNYVY